MTRREAQLTRAVICDDGRVKANFEDNSVLILDASGSTFTVCSPGGCQHRQLSAFAVSAYERKLALVLDFRNSHVEAPFHCRALRLLSRSGSSSFQAGFPLNSASWPSGPKQAAAERLLDAKPDGCLVLRSHNDTARMILLPHAQRLVVTFPLLIGEAPGGDHHFAWQTQTFWASRCPTRWLPALRVLLEAAGEPHDHLLAPPEGASMVQTPFPKASAGDSSAVGGPWGAFASGSWWTECSTSLFPQDSRLLTEWRPEATYHWFADEAEARLVLHHDGSTMATFQGGRFLRHSLLPASRGTAVYAADAVPRTLRGPTGEACECDLVAIAAHTALFREAAARLEREVPPSAPGRSSNPREKGQSVAGGKQPGPQAISSSVREVEEEPGVGRFVSYQDGRVRAVFVDRTILDLDAAGKEAELLMPDGSRLRVAASNPLGAARHVAAACAFRSRSFATAEQRAEALRTRAGLEVELASSGRVADMLSFALTGTVPDAPAKQGDPAPALASPEEQSRPQAPRPQMHPANGHAELDGTPKEDCAREGSVSEPAAVSASAADKEKKTPAASTSNDEGARAEVAEGLQEAQVRTERAVDSAPGMGFTDGYQGQDLAALIRQHLESSSRILEKLDPLI